MIARPLVAGTIAGAILGDIPTGLKLGVVFELLQYDILPVGAVRYPEYGPATIAAVATAHASAGVLGLGLGALVGLVTGLVGGLAINRAAARELAGSCTRGATRLESGDPRALMRVPCRRTCCATPCARRSSRRSGLCSPGSRGRCSPARSSVRGAVLLAVATVGAALAAGAAGTLRLVGRGPESRVVRRRLGRRPADGGMAAVKGAASPARCCALFAVQGSYNYERHARRWRRRRGRAAAARPRRRKVPARCGARRAFLQCASLPGRVWPSAPPRGPSTTAPRPIRSSGCARRSAARSAPLGDRLVWAGWLPFLSALDAGGRGAGRRLDRRSRRFLFVYNIGHVALRWWALKAGWTHGTRVSVALHHPVLQKATTVLGPAMALAVGLALPVDGALPRRAVRFMGAARTARSSPPWRSRVTAPAGDLLNGLRSAHRAARPWRWSSDGYGRDRA